MLRFLRNCALIVVFCSVSVDEIAHATVTVRFDPPDFTVDVGETFSLNIVADIPDPIIAWGLDLAIGDDTVLSAWSNNAQLSSPLIGANWFSPGSTPDGDLLAGVGFPNSVSGGSIVLATVEFIAEAEGSAVLTLSDDNPFPHVSPPNDLTEGFGLDPVGFADVTYEFGQVTVVPEPFFVMGLLVVIVLTMPVNSRNRVFLRQTI